MHRPAKPNLRLSPYLLIAISLVIFFLVGVSSVEVNQSNNLNRVATDSRVLTSMISSLVTPALKRSQSSNTMTELSTLKGSQNISLVCIYNKLGTVIIRYVTDSKNITPCPDQPLTQNFQHKDNHIHLFQTIQSNEAILGNLYVELNIAWVHQQRTNQYFLVSILGIVFFVFSLVLLFYFKKQIEKPLNLIGETSRLISSSSNYTFRVPVNLRSSYADTIRTFNDMLDMMQLQGEHLQDSEKKFRQLASLSPVGIFQFDLESNIKYVNQSWSDITGISQSEMSIENCVKQIRYEDKKKLIHEWQKLSKHHKGFVMELGFNHKKWGILEATVMRDHNGVVVGYMGAVSDITDLKNAQIQMEHLAFYDALTGLSNRRLFKERLRKALKDAKRHQSRVALLFLDLDQFKMTNDSLGHDVGDQLLIEVSSRLSDSIRETDTVSRIGGDEFTVLLTDIYSSHDVIAIAEKILNRLRLPISINSQKVKNSVSIGITIAPDDGDDANTLMRHADLAMYQAKARGRNNFQFFSEEMNAEILNYFEIEKNLRQSLERDQELIVYYQPKVQLSDYEFKGAEALLRWKPKGEDMIPPDRFIPIAEDSGLIITIGKWVLRQACQQIKRLVDQDLWHFKARMAVNLSAKQFSDSMLLQDLQSILHSTGCPANFLELEITESTLMDNVERAIDTMRSIQAMGISITIDDFGTGYSSLSYLKRFPIDTVKVDRSFVMDIPSDENDMAITAAVIAMAHKLHMTVVAEGIETLEQMAFLKANHCEFGQGFFFSRPVPSSELIAYIRRPFEVASGN